jgi:hypothetical protein
MEKLFCEFCPKKGKKGLKKQKEGQIHVSKTVFKMAFRNIEFFFTRLFSPWYSSSPFCYGRSFVAFLAFFPSLLLRPVPPPPFNIL